MQDSLRHRLLGVWARLISRHPWWVLLLAAVTVAGSVALTATRLTFQPDRNDLLSRSLPWNQTFIDWQTNFPGGNDLIVVVDPGARDGADLQTMAKAAAAVDELAVELKKLTPGVSAQPRVKEVLWGFDTAKISPRMIRTLPRDDFERRVNEMRESGPLLVNASLPAMVGAVVNELKKTGAAKTGTPKDEEVIRSLEGLRHLIQAIAARVESPTGDTDFGQLAESAAGPRWQYLESTNGRLLFVRVTPAPQAGELNEYAAAILAIREAMARVTPHHPGVEMGLTGVSVLETDETEAATFDTAVASIVSFALITGMLVMAFHSWKSPLLAMLSLLAGLAWTYGFVTITIGHLQVISVIVAPMLLGISDAYGVHLATKLDMVRHDYPDDVDGFAAALQKSFEVMGPGILTGAITTAAAFFTTVFTDFKGVAEMGLIAAAGILLCLVAMFSVYPAMLRLTKSRHKDIKPVQARRIQMFRDEWVMPFARHPKVTLIVAGVLTFGSLLAVTQMTYDYNLEKLLPRGFDSVRWQQRIANEGGVSIWYGVSMCRDFQEAKERTEKLRKPDKHGESVIAEVGGVGMLFPVDDEEKRERLKEAGSYLEKPLLAVKGPPDSPPPPRSRDNLLGQLTILKIAMSSSVPADAPKAIRDALSRLDQAMDRATMAIQKLEGDEQNKRLDALDVEYAAWRQRTAERIQKALDLSPLTLQDLPPDLAKFYQDAGGRLLLEIHPRLPDDARSRAEGPLSPRFLPRFYEAMTRVDPDVTGPAPQIYLSGQLIKWSYMWAGLYAVIAVFVLVWIDFRRVSEALMSLAPVAVGFALTFGVMWLLGMTVTPANIIVLPLMFGIGVDAGVHVIHRYRQDTVRRPLGLTDGTGKAITVTTLTTVVGFGTLMFASHRGIASLGFVLTVGVLLSMFACWVMLPAMLELVERRRRR